jgi:hypothetical protein
LCGYGYREVYGITHLCQHKPTCIAIKFYIIIIINFSAFLNKPKDKGDKYIVGWDSNEPHTSDTVIDLLQETEIVNAFLEFFPTHPATQSQGSLQIELILISSTHLEEVDNAFTLDPTNSQRDHFYIVIVFNLAKLLQ